MWEEKIEFLEMRNKKLKFKKNQLNLILIVTYTAEKAISELENKSDAWIQNIVIEKNETEQRKFKGYDEESVLKFICSEF